MATFVLIPGAGGQAWYWHRLVPELVARGHEPVPVELPGDDDSAGLAEYTDVVVGAIGDRADRDGPLVLVAQSFGGFTGPLVCAKVPVDLLVMLNAMTPAPGESPGDWWANTGQAAARQARAEADGRVPSEEFDLRAEFFHDVPAEVTEEGMAGGRPQSDTPFALPWPLATWPDVPTRVLIGRDDRFLPPEFQHRVVRERLGRTPDEMPGGHLVALSRPAELADRLVGYLGTVQ
jgi:pimeloyl-ACP methyl ester carboxylesterase